MATKVESRMPKATSRTSPSKAPRGSATKKTARSADKPAATKPARTAQASLTRTAPDEAKAGTKQSRLIALLRNGATLPQMTKLTGWQPHTVRGTISGVLRKKLGLSVSCAVGEAGIHVYRIVEST